MVAHCSPGLPAHARNSSGGIAGSASGGGAGAASVAGGGPVVGRTVVEAGGLALQALTAQSAAPMPSRVHTLDRTGPTLSCRPMFRIATRIAGRVGA